MIKVVVVGGGQAAASCVARLRSKGFEGEIALLCDEPVPPYQRPPLSKAYLLGEMPQDRLLLRPDSYYADQSIALHLNSRATRIDPAAQVVQTDGGAYPYDHLVLCTGSAPIALPSALGGTLNGVFTLRTLADVDALRPKVTEGARALIVGGGYIGLEAAAVAAKLGLQVTLVEMAPRILQRVAAEQTSGYFRDLHSAHGVDLREGTGLARLLGDDHVTGAELADGTTLEVDLVLVGIGIRPETGLAEAAGLTIDNGILVNARGQTSQPNIWAAGDCAAFPHAGGTLRLESVGNAIDMGELVADNILGAEADYIARPWFWSDQYDTKLQIAGLSTGFDRVVERHGANGAVSFWYYANGQLIALDAMNDPRAYMVGKRLIEAGRSPVPDAVADPETDLKSLLSA